MDLWWGVWIIGAAFVLVCVLGLRPRGRGEYVAAALFFFLVYAAAPAVMTVGDTITHIAPDGRSYEDYPCLQFGHSARGFAFCEKQAGEPNLVPLSAHLGRELGRVAVYSALATLVTFGGLIFEDYRNRRKQVRAQQGRLW